MSLLPVTGSPPTGRQRLQVPLLGLFAMGSGIGLVYLYMTIPRLATGGNYSRVFYLGTGAVLLMWGLRAVVSELWTPLARLGIGQRRSYRVKMPQQAIAYLVILFTIFLGSMLGKNNLLMLVFGFMAGPFVLNGSVTFSMLRGADANRVLPDQALVGEPFSVDLLLSNRKHWFSSWMMFVQDRIASVDESLQATVLFTRVPARSARTGSYQLQLARRGRYVFGPLQVISRFPLGLVERALVINQTQELVVFPRLGQLTDAWRRANSTNSQLIHKPNSIRGAFDDEFHRLREYRPGDNPRAIHWRTSARRNELMVREFHQNRDQDMLLILDLWLSPQPTSAERERVELAISFAATICVEHCRQAGECHFWLGLSGKESSRWTGSANALAVNELLGRLALAEAGPSSGLPELVRSLTGQSGPSMRKVLISTRPASEIVLRDARGTAEDAAQSMQIIEATPAGISQYFVASEPEAVP